MKDAKRCTSPPRRANKNRLDYSLLECFIVLWWPVVVLGLGAEFALLVSQVRPQGVDLHKWPEHGVGLPDEVVHGDHWEKRQEITGTVSAKRTHALCYMAKWLTRKFMLFNRITAVQDATWDVIAGTFSVICNISASFDCQCQCIRQRGVMCLHQFCTDVSEMKVLGCSCLGRLLCNGIRKPKKLLHFIIKSCRCCKNWLEMKWKFPCANKQKKNMTLL